ncbi:hypothetical protein EW146_g6752 [Bondarzewia mesenterica]|uniref:Ig-like domain-containing protein n=1 Tax=Bondarzewia mesenterica TaxID=1095465 RepID=A0A4S4LTB3_9AGAM|nr:hypothetical protein EW146_g6752 [Bondarzewia mesenterica]
MSTTKEAPPNQPQPRIPEKYLDVPTQRLYVLSFGLLVQAIKLFDYLQYLFAADNSNIPHYGRKWLVVDFLYCVGLGQLRIPRLNYATSIIVVQVLLLWILDGFLFGGIRLRLFGGSGDVQAQEIATTSAFSIASILSIATFGIFSGKSYTGKDAHLLGQHTVRMSPISTAFLNPFGQTFCLPTPSSSVLIPLLLNNTSPQTVEYLLTPLGYVEGEDVPPKKVVVHSRELRAIENARAEELRRVKGASRLDADDYDYDEGDEDEEERDPHSTMRLQKTQSLAHIRLSTPGTVRLNEVQDNSRVGARIVYPSEITIAPCPRAQFTDGDAITRGDNVRCAAPGLGGIGGEDRDFQLGLDVYGVPPLSLKWFKDINGKREYFTVEGIEGGHVDRPDGSRPSIAAAQDVYIPLTVSAEALGTHIYALESVMDNLGNVDYMGYSSPGRGGNNTLSAEASTNTTRTVHVLRRPTVSFKGCGPGNPASLRIGSEVSLTVFANEADPLDSPWDVTIKYQPSLGLDENGKSANKRFRPWKKTLTTQEGKRDLVVKTNIPGEYTIVDVKGKYCEGDVLSPEMCTVVELPRPTAEIEWRRIHECSGDTGVSASLVLHGTPPFQIGYRMQRDKEHPRESVQTFSGSRGEMTLQPPRSGHYIYTFTHISDANYQKVELKGPSIDQIVHPLATANFVQTGPPGRDKQTINSCSGDMGTGPWNLEVQLVGPKGSEIISFRGIDTPRKTLQLPVPKAIDRDGGSFEIDLVSIEDSYGCKRSLSVPGVSVNVRRVKPTAKFYGKEGKRHVTILDHEQASLPLRLTGDGPWRIKYRTLENPDYVQQATLHTPNDNLRVNEKGLYEIIEVTDSQCPGTIFADASTYKVEWVPRPSARLSQETKTLHEAFNGSFILPPICEGQSDHVDLDLTGRSPFQIMYNIARAGETGGTKLLDQPIFNSIQSRTRFQLHTSDPGRIFYEVKQVGDAAYPLSKHKGAVIPRYDRPLFEQEVLMRPYARFSNQNRLQYCLHDTLTPRDKSTLDGVVSLEGTPPFELKLSVRNLAAGETYTETVKLTESTWKLNLPSYAFKSIGKHYVTIESIRDASHCEQATPDPHERSIWVEVAESAAIVPFDRREHFCVGEVSQFQLEGIPPWTIGYRINGRSYTHETSVSPFALVQQQPGEFKITSIAHKQKMCKSVVTDLTYTVHPLPSAQVGHGKRIFQDIHEGDQAEITFTLIGEPPFTFTYQRAEVSGKKGSKPGMVLETHTVSGITTKEYSIFSAMEGTWTVTFISDRYCRYPMTSPDANVEKR